MLDILLQLLIDSWQYKSPVVIILLWEAKEWGEKKKVETRNAVPKFLKLSILK